ncbi:GSCFA domain protein [Labilibaculum filiforme]|uniref:GSCFA domain protein n=1 Tax=Labilibaculum filiforme TaxID=1940526 RepID=A0A2N3HXC3_9BACT|nr:GSCFA domain-containing protein [Labilibaculum filiforme]PKQ62699.1 GSCFA domain protein [Labilibaculum filiforme]
MTLFRTNVKIPVSQDKFDYNSKAIMLGSCFTESIGEQLAKFKFDVNINPFGVIYNPISVGNSLKILIENKKFTEEDLNFSNERWFSFAHHGRFSNTDVNECLDAINTEVKKSSLDLANSDVLYITFGTSWVFELLDTGIVVSNCHKLPAREFHRYRLDVDEIVQFYKKLIVSLSVFNPNLKIVFTVSPIRHWKDGAHGNQLSKATLLLAIEQLVDLFDQVSYFPSYEIVMDELRDYRFYAEDMLHMNSSSVNYIWSRFVDTYMTNQTLAVMKRVDKIVVASNHRPFNADAISHQQFITNTLDDLERLEREYPNIVFNKEKSRLLKNLHH